MRTIVFLGPTMPVEDARAILPDARYLPPARQADVISAIRAHAPDVIALIDGVFHQSLSVWHKEILYALERGVRVYGASSMGALRAAECAPFGMVGVGSIYERYASGELVRDDEVALAHGDAESGWRPMSVPLVNVRATLDAAVEAGAIPAASADALLEAAAEIYFAERTWPLVAARAAEAGVDPGVAEAAAAFAREHAVDRKRLDAEELLALLRDLPDDAPAPDAVPVNRSHVFEALLERDVRVERMAGAVSLEEIGRHAMLHRPDAAQIMERALDRALVAVLGDVMRVEVEEAEVDAELERLRARLGLGDELAYEAYLLRNDLEEAELRALLRDVAIGRRLREWLTVRRYKLGLTQPLLDELRLADEYAPAADAAAELEAALRERFPPTHPFEVEPEETPELLREQSRATGWRPDTDLATWAAEAGFANVADVLTELKRAQAARDPARSA